MGDFWIESLIREEFVGAASVENHDINLEKPGHFVAISSNIHIPNSISSTMAEFQITCRNTDGSFLNYGDPITAIRMTLVNNSVAGLTTGGQIIVILKK